MSWVLNPNDSQILAVHAACMNYDQIVYFGGDQFDPALAAAHKIEATRLFDCNSGAVTKIASPPFDVFCSGHAMTTEGTLVVGGGTANFPETITGLHHKHFPGLRDTAIFRYEPAHGARWKKTADFNSGSDAPICRPGQDPNVDECTTPDNRGKTGGRWYPTLITLGNGNIVAIGGHPGAGDRWHDNFIPEVFTPSPAPMGAWHRLGSFDTDLALFQEHTVTYYSRAHLLPSGDIIFATPTFALKTVTMTVHENPWSATFANVCDFEPLDGDQYGGWTETSVLLPLVHPTWHPRVLLCNGSTPWLLDLGGWNPTSTPTNQIRWQNAGPRALAGSPRRMNGNAVLLPTGEVLIIGGVHGELNAAGELVGLDSDAERTPEIFDPWTNDPAKRWKALNNQPEQVVRQYHSVALLMRDGRVWVAGSSHDAQAGKPELRIEIFEPWYWGDPDRPEITSAPDRWLTSETFAVQTTQASRIQRVAMVRAGSCTHAFDPDQRYLSLAFKHTGGDNLDVTAAPNGNIAPPGLYHLYTINDHGLPSEGITVHHSTDPETVTQREWNALYGD